MPDIQSLGRKEHFYSTISYIETYRLLSEASTVNLLVADQNTCVGGIKFVCRIKASILIASGLASALHPQPCS